MDPFIYTLVKMSEISKLLKNEGKDDLYRFEKLLKEKPYIIHLKDQQHGMNFLQTAIHETKNIDFIKKIIEAGADVNEKDVPSYYKYNSGNDNPLHTAVVFSNANGVNLL
jgi:ankyrin repeat protein